VVDEVAIKEVEGEEEGEEEGSERGGVKRESKGTTGT